MNVIALSVEALAVARTAKVAEAALGAAFNAATIVTLSGNSRVLLIVTDTLQLLCKFAVSEESPIKIETYVIEQGALEFMAQFLPQADEHVQAKFIEWTAWLTANVRERKAKQKEYERVQAEEATALAAAAATDQYSTTHPTGGIPDYSHVHADAAYANWIDWH